MKTFVNTNLQLPSSDDLNSFQDFKAAAIKDRVTDSRSWGILRKNAYPSVLAAPPALLDSVTEFVVVLDTSAGTLTVGAGSNSSVMPHIVGGVAYDINGERIAILDDATYNADNNIPEGKRSSGNLAVPLATGDTFVWIEYLGVNDPTYQSILRNGAITYPKLLDGYKIVLTADATPPIGEGVSVFLCKVTWVNAVAGSISVSDGTEAQVIASIPTGNILDTIPAEVKRVYSLVRQNQVEVIVDPATPTSSYPTGERLTVQDHVGALGSTAPTVNNPHGTTLDDIPGGKAEPKAVKNLDESMSSGFIDLTLSQNSPREQSAVALPIIEQTTLTPIGLNAITIAGSGIDDTVKDAWVRITDFDTDQLAYLSGVRYTALYPTLMQSSQSSDPNNSDGWVGFANTEAAGTYRVFAQPAMLAGAYVLLLRKILLGDPTLFPNEASTMPRGYLLLGQVYWDGNDLYRDSLQVSTSAGINKPVDQRSLGLVGNPQLSNDLKAAALANHVSENLIGNSGFTFDKPTPTAPFPSWIIDSSAGAGYLPTTNIEQADYTSQPLLATGGPGALFSARLSPIAGQTTGTTKMYAHMTYMKPSTTYAISFWYLAEAGWNSRVMAGLVTDTTYTSVITTGSPLGSPLDVHIIGDAVFHRAIVFVKTLDGFTPTTDYFLELRFDATANATTTDKMYITNVQVTEGEWVSGYSSGGSSIPAGANVFFDDRSVCPTGWVENTNLSGRMPMGLSFGGINGAGIPGSLLGNQITDGDVHTDSKSSSVTLDKAQGGSDATWIRVDTHTHTTGILVGIWCRAIGG